jgi:hypothetical protein
MMMMMMMMMMRRRRRRRRISPHQSMSTVTVTVAHQTSY